MYELVQGAYKQASTLAIADLHVGYAAQLRADGIHIPTNEANNVLTRIKRLLKQTTPETVIINGDLKHAFGTIHEDEWRVIRQLTKHIQQHAQLILIQGNHDPLLTTIAQELNLPLHKEYRKQQTLYIHGDKKPRDLQGIQRIVIGHQHPAIRLGTAVRTELVKCYLTGEYQGKELIVLPSFFELQAGSDVLQEKPITPLITDFSKLHVHALVGKDVLHYGTVQQVAKLREETL